MRAARAPADDWREIGRAIAVTEVVVIGLVADVVLMPRQLVDQFIEVIAHGLIDVHQFGVEVVEDGRRAAQASDSRRLSRG